MTHFASTKKVRNLNVNLRIILITCSVFPLCMQYANKNIPGACSDAVPGLKSLKDGFRLHMP